MGQPWQVEEWSMEKGWRITEIVPVAPKDLQCPTCGSTHLRSIEAWRAKPAKRSWRTLWRPVEPTPPCPACRRTDSHYHLTCDDCGRVWDIGEPPMLDSVLANILDQFGNRVN